MGRTRRISLLVPVLAVFGSPMLRTDLSDLSDHSRPHVAADHGPERSRRLVRLELLLRDLAERVPLDHDGEREHRLCSECGQLAGGTSTWTQASRQASDVTGTIVEVGSPVRRPKASPCEDLQTRSVPITSARCSNKTFTTVEATPWP